MLTWSKPNAIVPDEPLRWILATLRFYAIVAGVGITLAFAVISIRALVLGVLHDKGIVGTGTIDRIKGGGGIGGDTMVVLIAMIILFAAATYFTRELHGKAGYIAYGVGFVVVPVVLFVLWLSFFG
jgi:hypothetical protein